MEITQSPDDILVPVQNSDVLLFYCPGCEEAHQINRTWQITGPMSSPTVSPSVLVTKPANPDAIEEFKEWRTERRCHSFIRDGQIEYLGDSTHPLANTTLALQPFARWRDAA